MISVEWILEIFIFGHKIWWKKWEQLRQHWIRLYIDILYVPYDISIRSHFGFIPLMCTPNFVLFHVIRIITSIRDCMPIWERGNSTGKCKLYFISALVHTLKIKFLKGSLSHEWMGAVGEVLSTCSLYWYLAWNQFDFVKVNGMRPITKPTAKLSHTDQTYSASWLKRKKI